MSALRRLVVVGMVVLGLLAVGAAPASAGAGHKLIATIRGSETPAGSIGPQDVAVARASGDVYVSDGSNSVVDVFNSAGVYLPALQLTGTPEGEFNTPRSVAVDQKTGDVYVSVGVNGEAVVAVFSSSGEYLSRITGSETPAGSMFPFGVAVNESNGDVYVTDRSNGVVDVFNAAGVYQPALQLTGTPAGAPVSGPFKSLLSLTIDQATGEVYVADGGSGVVDVFSSTGAYLSQVNGSATPAKAMSPWSVAVDESDGELYVGDFEYGVVDEFSSAGVYQGQITGGETAAGSMTPYGIAFDGSRNVYIADATNEAVDVDNSLSTPVFVLGAPSNVQGTGVTLNGSVNPGGSTVSSCEFEYAIEPAEPVYAHSVGCSPSPGSGEGFVPVSANVTGLEPHRVYHYRITATNTGGASSSSDATFETGVVAPAVNDRAAYASGVTQTTATLNGTIDPGNVPAAYRFEYGTTTGYGSLAPTPDLYTPANNVDDTVTPQTLTGLRPGTTYHFALSATGSGGISTGPDETFTTLPVPAPAVATGSSSEVALGAATLSGSIDPQGWATGYHFEYGTTTSYGSNWPTVDVTLGALEGPQAILTHVENLQPGTLYHYRLAASNPGGTNYGADQTFTTPQYPASVIQEAIFLKGPLGVNPEAGKPAKAKPKGKGKGRSRHRKRAKKGGGKAGHRRGRRRG